MGANEELRLAPATHVVHGGTQDVAKDQWLPFEWEEPRLGRCVHGEIAIIRPSGTSGTLMAGFWRTGPTSPGAQTSGVESSSPDSSELLQSIRTTDQFCAVSLNGQSLN